MSPFVRPGPKSVPPGQAPGGLVIQVYSHPGHVFLFQRNLPAEALLGDVARQGTIDAEATQGHESVVVVVFDGDTGQRFATPDWAWGKNVLP